MISVKNNDLDEHTLHKIRCHPKSGGNLIKITVSASLSREDSHCLLPDMRMEGILAIYLS